MECPPRVITYKITYIFMMGEIVGQLPRFFHFSQSWNQMLCVCTGTSYAQFYKLVQRR